MADTTIFLRAGFFSMVAGLTVASAQAMVISDFSTPMTFSQSGLGATTQTVSDATSHIIGGYQDVTARVTSKVGIAKPNSVVAVGDNGDSLTIFQNDLSSSAYGLTTLIWDGSSVVSGDGVGDGTGKPAAYALNADVTEGGLDTRFRVAAWSDKAEGQLIVTVYKNADDYAYMALNLLGDSMNNYDFAFNQFTFAGNFTLSDFTSVGAIKLEIDARSGINGNPVSLDVALDNFQTTHLPEPSSAIMMVIGLAGMAYSTMRRRV